MEIKEKINSFLYKHLPSDKVDALYLIYSQYHFSLFEKPAKPMIISAYDGRTGSVGFADRLRGMLSCYAYAKAKGLLFRIDHIDPFKLSDYLVPNKYDWVYKEGEKSTNIMYACPIYIMNRSMGGNYHWIPKWRQTHFFTNVNFIPKINDYYHTEFIEHELFEELFTPEGGLREKLDEIQENLGKYISVSFRFLNLLGDFEDIHNEELDEESKMQLMERCKHQLFQLRTQNLEFEKVLVTADSQKFIDYIKDVDWAYTIPGDIGHIGYVQKDSIYVKMFLDFLTISRAQKVYMVHTGKMYRSNFSKMAALIGGRPFEDVAF